MSSSPVNSLDDWLQVLGQASSLIELASLGLSALLAWIVVSLLRRSLDVQDPRSILFGRRVLDGVLFPALLVCMAYASRALLARGVPLAVMKIAIPVLLALLVIRLGVKVLQVAFSETPLVRLLERSISWLAWIAMVLWVSGLLPLILEEFELITWKVGGSVISLRTLIEGALTAGAVLILTLWLSAAVEARLLRSATGGELSVRKAISHAARALLLLVGLMLTLSAVGIDLTALSVLGGAIGVGVGFGLQKLAANYVSGFVILAERSMRIGDNVRLDNFEGRITHINARYSVIRSLTGRESIVPNEMLITNRVENLSLADARVWQSTVVQVGYDSDVAVVLRLLEEAATGPSRVLHEPAPAAYLSAFAPDGLEFTLGYWITDPENGTLNVKSAINLEVLRQLRAHGVEFAYPQRVVHAGRA